MSILYTISNWYGRLGNNIQQICNGIIFSEINDSGFFTPPHELIDQIMIKDPFDEDTLVIHIRSGDIFAHEHNPPHDYVPNPLVYYLNLIEEYEKVIVVTEPDNYNPIIDELRKNNKVTIQSSNVSDDFSTLLRAKNLASSGVGTFAVAAALCSNNIKKFYCTNLYLDEHLNPEMLYETDISVYMMELNEYINLKEWKNNEEQCKCILEYKIK